MKKLYLGFYSGTSLISRLIRWQTWSKYSHVSMIIADSDNVKKWIEYEAWHVSDKTKWYRPLAGYFQKVPFGKNHKKGTKVDLFEVEGITSLQIDLCKEQAENFARKKIPYDYSGVSGFLVRKPYGDNNKLFCSESIVEILKFASIKIINVESYKTSPGTLSLSPIITYRKTLLTTF